MFNTLNKFKFQNVFKTIKEKYSFRLNNQSFMIYQSNENTQNMFRISYKSFNKLDNTTLKNLDLDLLLENKGNRDEKLISPDEILTIKNKKDKKDFVKENNILDFTPELSWEEVVVKSLVPIVVDCHAEWCNPCKKLLPVIYKKLEEMQNFRLVKINIDNNPDLTESLNVHNVPTIFLVYKGNIVDHFVGVPDDKRLKEFFDSINILVGISENDQIMRSLLKGAEEWMNKEQWDNAENMFIEANSYEKWKDQYGAIIKLGLAICSFNKSEINKTEAILKELLNLHKKDIDSDTTLKKKVALLEIKLNLIKNPDLLQKQVEDFEEKIRNNPKDLNLRYSFAIKEFENSSYEKAINILLDLIKIDRNWNNKAAHQLLLKIFGYLGSDNDLVIKNRRELSKIIF